MPQTDQRRSLIDLFRETGPAHHRAYFAANGADPEWPLWYAEYSLDGILRGFLSRPLWRYGPADAGSAAHVTGYNRAIQGKGGPGRRRATPKERRATLQ